MIPWPSIELTLRVANARSARSPPRPGTPAPIRLMGRDAAAMRADLAPARQCPTRNTTLRSHITHSFHTTFFRRSRLSQSVRTRGRLAAHASAGRRRQAARSSAPSPATRNPIRSGEYVFDHGWAEAYERAGGSYYPKLQVVGAVHAGDRRAGSWCGPGPQADAVRAALADALVDVCRRSDASSVHVTFPTAAGMAAARRATAILKRTHQQFHWENGGYDSLRRLPGGARLAQAQDHPPRARGRPGRTASACIG